MCRKSSVNVGERYGKLTVVKPTKFKYNNGRVWECRCDCGNTVMIPARSLASGNTQSCGCLKSEWASVRTIFCHQARSSTGYRGVYYNRKTGKYFAKIMNEGHTYNLGSYKKLTDAVKARRRAEEEYHFPRMEAYERRRVSA